MMIIMSKAAMLNKELDLKNYKGINVYHNAKFLLQLYSKVLWRIEHSLDNIKSECFEFHNIAIDSLLGMNGEVDQLNFESRLESLQVSRRILEMVNRALVLLRSYPDNGERYFDIINKMYIINYKYNESEMLEYLNIGRTTFYKDKKQAVKMLGVILWGFIIPDMVSQHNYSHVAETSEEIGYVISTDTKAEPIVNQ